MLYKVFCNDVTTSLQGGLQGFYNMFTRCLARLAKHVYNVLCKAFTPCLTWCLKRCSQGVSQCVPQGFYNAFCYKVFTRVFYNVFTRDFYRRLVQGASTMCLLHFHRAFQQCDYNTFTMFLEGFEKVSRELSEGF